MNEQILEPKPGQKVSDGRAMNTEKENKAVATAKTRFYTEVEAIKLTEMRRMYDKKYISMDRPLISVYTPTYNRGELLIERAVTSVLAQTYTNFEYIIVGDGCTDLTESLIKQINDPRIIFYNMRKRKYRYPPTAFNHWLVGPVVAANQALSMVTGDWIARLDDDDSWTADHLEQLLGCAKGNNSEFVSGAAETLSSEGQVEIKGGAHPAYNAKRYLKVDSEFDPHGRVRIGAPSSWMYRSYLDFMVYNIDCWRKAYNKVNDTDLMERMYRMGVRFGFVKKAIISYVPRPGESVGSLAYTNNIEEIENKYAFSN